MDFPPFLVAALRICSACVASFVRGTPSNAAKAAIVCPYYRLSPIEKTCCAAIVVLINAALQTEIHSLPFEVIRLLIGRFMSVPPATGGDALAMILIIRSVAR